MKLLPAFALIFAVQSAFASEDMTATRSVLPLGAITKSSKITWDEVDTSQNYFLPSASAGSYEKTNANSLVSIKSLENSSLSAADNMELQSRISDNSLVVQ